MSGVAAPLHHRIRSVRARAGVSQEAAAAALGISQPTYSRIEDGSRHIKGDELIRLADACGVRVGAITGLAEVAGRTRLAARTDGGEADMASLRDHLYAYFELDAFLAEQGFPAA